MKQVFNVIIYTGDLLIGSQGFITYHKVSSIDAFKKFASGKYPKWTFATVYDKATRAKIEVIKP